MRDGSRSTLLIAVLAMLGATPFSDRACTAADGLMPDEVSLQYMRVFGDVTKLSDSANGVGGRASWQLFGPIIADFELWNASIDGDGTIGGFASAKFLLEGLVTGFYGRAGLGRYDGKAATSFAGGMELYLLKKAVLRGEAQLLLRDGDKDLAFSFGIGFRL